MKKNVLRRSFILSFIAFILCFLLISSLFLYISLFVIGGFAYSGAGAPYAETPVVIIDAGHGGEDGGTIGVNGALEKDINLTLAKKIQVFLESFGIRCVLTRSEDVLLYDRNEDYEGRKKVLDMRERKRIVESYDNAILVSIHQNAFPQERYSGFQVYYSPNDERSSKLATLLEETMRATLQPNNNRVSKQSSGSIYLLDKLTCPAVLIECGFLSNAEECALLCNEEYQNKLCAVIASAIADFVKY